MSPPTILPFRSVRYYIIVSWQQVGQIVAAALTNVNRELLTLEIRRVDRYNNTTVYTTLVKWHDSTKQINRSVC